MKKPIVLISLVIFLTAGCVHQTPLTTEHPVAIDPGLLGWWERVPGEAKGNLDEDRMVVLKWSDTEYLAQHPTGVKGEFFRAYPVEIDGLSLIQAEYIGNHQGEWYPPDKNLYPVITYEIVEGILIVSSLNPGVVDEGITDSDVLRQAFLENKDRPDLFNPPAHYRRVEHQ